MITNTEARLNSPDLIERPGALRSNAHPIAARTMKKLHKKFKALFDEEDRIVQQRIATDFLYAHFNYRTSGEFGGWWFEGITTERLEARFALLATEGGIALGCPPNTLPRVYWLHCLRLDLRTKESTHLGVCNDAAGIIERLCEASAAYCMSLHRQLLEETVMPITPPERRGYRSEVRHWMALEGIDSVEGAAKRLGLSWSALKSIMSDRGYRRYGAATLSRVLDRIGYKGEHPHRAPIHPLI